MTYDITVLPFHPPPSPHMSKFFSFCTHGSPVRLSNFLSQMVGVGHHQGQWIWQRCNGLSLAEQPQANSRLSMSLSLTVDLACFGIFRWFLENCIVISLGFFCYDWSTLWKGLPFSNPAQRNNGRLAPAENAQDFGHVGVGLRKADDTRGLPEDGILVISKHSQLPWAIATMGQQELPRVHKCRFTVPFWD